MNASPSPKCIRSVVRWLIGQALERGVKTGRWLAWILLPIWFFAFSLGAVTEFLEHI